MSSKRRGPHLAYVVLPLLLASASPAAARTLVQRGAALVDEGRFAEAERVLRQAIGAEGQQAEAAFYLGRVYLETGRAPAAIRLLEGMARRYPESSRIQQGLGEAYAVEALSASVFRQIGLARESRRSLERAVALDPDNVEARVSLFEFYRHAPGVVGGSVERALGQVRRIERRNPSRGHELRANLLRDQDRASDALAEYHLALAADPDNLQARLSLALLHTERREFDLAFPVLDGLLERDPGHMSALYQIGRNAALSGRRLEEGEAALRRYLAYRPRRNQPSHAWALYRLGMIHKRRGELASARYRLGQAVSLDPELSEAREMLQKLSS
jgi:tetratricopeptide (TPR) repeat protein